MYFTCKEVTIAKCASADRARRNKNSEQSANNQVWTQISFCCQTLFVVLSLKSLFFFGAEISFFLTRGLFLCVGFCTVYVRYSWPDTMCEVFFKK